MTEAEIREKVRCGTCHGKIGHRINMVELDRKATWDYPTSGNVLTGTSGIAVAIICDRCVEEMNGTAAGALPGGDKILEAVEFRVGEAIYHPVESLEKVAQ